MLLLWSTIDVVVADRCSPAALPLCIRQRRRNYWCTTRTQDRSGDEIFPVPNQHGKAGRTTPGRRVAPGDLVPIEATLLPLVELVSD